MKSLDFYALQSYANWIFQKIENAQLQTIESDENFLVLQFYKFNDFYLNISMLPNHPFVLLSPENLLKKKSKKPVVLFLGSHAKNKRLLQINCDPQKGRVLELILGVLEDPLSIEVILIPGQPNVIAQFPKEKKKISWNKPRDLLLQAPPESSIDKSIYDENFWLNYSENLQAEYFIEKKQPLETAGLVVSENEKKKAQNLAKKAQLLVKLEGELKKQSTSFFQDLAQKLKNNLPLSPEETAFVNPLKNRFENAQHFFDLAKKNLLKNKGLQQRIETLKAEIEKMQEADFVPPEKKISSVTQMMKKTSTQGRKKIIADQLEVVVGKSAQDNLKLLRSARAWDYFLHLRNQPGAYGIIFREKNKNLSQAELFQAAQYLVEQSLKKNKPLLGKFEILWTECRYVRPIKGATIGLVNYSHEKVFTLSL